MLIYIFIFVLAIILSVLFNKSKDKRVLAFPLISMAIYIGLGDMMGGYDRYIYGHMFDIIADGVRSKQNISSYYYLVSGMEYGYFFVEYLIAHITANRYVFILMIILLEYFLYYKAISRYIEDYPFSIIIFLGLFFFFTMTYLRQSVAVGLVWLSFRYVIDRNLFKFLLFVLLGASFHSSALIALPIYFIPIIKYSKISLIGVLIFFFLLGLTSFSSMLLIFSGDVGNMANRTAAYASDQLSGFRIEYLLEVIFFIFIFFINDKKLNRTKETLFFYNLSIYFCIILLLFIRFGQGGRLGWYFMIGIIYMLTKISNISKMMKPFIALLSFLLYLRVTFAWGVNIYPYKTFLSPGIPMSGKELFYYNEYDSRYEVNKLYRPVIDLEI